MEITGDMITQYGLMQKISTGNGVLDMVLVMLVPLIIRQALPWLYNFLQQFMTYSQEEKTYTRVIEFTRSSNYWWHSDSEGPSNQILQKALLTQINKRVDVIRALHRADFTLRNMTHHDADEAKGNEVVVVAKEDDEDNNSKDHAYCINAAPPAGIWMDLGNGIKFQRVLENLDDKGKTTRTVYNLESSEADGNERIDKFVTEALELYKLQQRAKVDLSRYMYVPVLTGWQIRPAEGETTKPSAIYKRYKLSEEKTFASFFHPEKESILTLVNHFLNKTGKFGIAGYPNKLGLLLYGPPGTGKTSFIKALAQFTKRSIISIPLTKIQTNQTLMDLMMDQKVQTEDGEGSNSLPFSKTIFVMEDVDAAGTVVHRRAPTVTTMTNMDLVVSGPVNKPSTREGADDGEGKKDRGDKDSDDEDGEKKKKAIGPTTGGTAGMGRSLWGGDDDLNLAGLLNVLDGVVDTPNRLVIMTTNHPEKLDPALIRPGRINKKIYMGRIKADDAVRMMKHYFGTLTEECISRLHTVFVDDVLSPAELEAMCAEHDTTELMVEELDRKFTAKFGPALTETSAVEGAGEITAATGAAAQVPAPSALTAASAFATHVPLPALVALDSVPGPCP